jgi:GSH-dependent disulfide-bond oxidoreductase
MINIYAYSTPNSVKVPIMLEEIGIDYSIHSIDLRKGEQKSDSFRALTLNAKVPVLVDTDGPAGQPLTLSESAAILVYLAEKSGKLLPASGPSRARVFEQLFFHASGLGASFGHAFAQRLSTPNQQDLISRPVAEAQRTLSVLDSALSRQSFVAGDELTIADIAHFGWLWRHAAAGVDLENAPNVQRWMRNLEERQAFRRGIERTAALSA